MQRILYSVRSHQLSARLLVKSDRSQFGKGMEFAVGVRLANNLTKKTMDKNSHQLSPMPAKSRGVYGRTPYPTMIPDQSHGSDQRSYDFVQHILNRLIP